MNSLRYGKSIYLQRVEPVSYTHLEIVHNPSYETLFEEETKAGLEGYEVGKETELGAVNVMTGIYTGRKSSWFVAVVSSVERPFSPLYVIVSSTVCVLVSTTVCESVRREIS